ncbi:hypothetical protein ACH42_05740 [Endozoicomonas sp. (ex Bugula neritina AB1)]|nr:hypothetical protein ACH42_05740 [Endozoicomonas sp. (ex Bugula neritina AB1)]
MKKVTGIIAALLISGSVLAVENAEKHDIYCKPMESNQTAKMGRFSTFAIKFYLTSNNDYKACREIAAADDGAKVIIDPNA